MTKQPINQAMSDIVSGMISESLKYGDLAHGIIDNNIPENMTAMNENIPSRESLLRAIDDLKPFVDLDDAPLPGKGKNPIKPVNKKEAIREGTEEVLEILEYEPAVATNNRFTDIVTMLGATVVSGAGALVKYVTPQNLTNTTPTQKNVSPLSLQRYLTTPSPPKPVKVSAMSKSPTDDYGLGINTPTILQLGGVLKSIITKQHSPLEKIETTYNRFGKEIKYSLGKLFSSTPDKAIVKSSSPTDIDKVKRQVGAVLQTLNKILQKTKYEDYEEDVKFYNAEFKQLKKQMTEALSRVDDGAKEVIDSLYKDVRAYAVGVMTNHPGAINVKSSVFGDTFEGSSSVRDSMNMYLKYKGMLLQGEFKKKSTDDQYEGTKEEHMVMNKMNRLRDAYTELLTEYMDIHKDDKEGIEAISEALDEFKQITNEMREYYLSTQEEDFGNAFFEDINHDPSYQLKAVEKEMIETEQMYNQYSQIPENEMLIADREEMMRLSKKINDLDKQRFDLAKRAKAYKAKVTKELTQAIKEYKDFELKTVEDIGKDQRLYANKFQASFRRYAHERDKLMADRVLRHSWNASARHIIDTFNKLAMNGSVDDITKYKYGFNAYISPLKKAIQYLLSESEHIATLNTKSTDDLTLHTIQLNEILKRLPDKPTTSGIDHATDGDLSKLFEEIHTPWEANSKKGGIFLGEGIFTMLYDGIMNTVNRKVSHNPYKDASAFEFLSSRKTDTISESLNYALGEMIHNPYVGMHATTLSNFEEEGVFLSEGASSIPLEIVSRVLGVHENIKDYGVFSLKIISDSLKNKLEVSKEDLANVYKETNTDNPFTSLGNDIENIRHNTSIRVQSMKLWNSLNNRTCVNNFTRRGGCDFFEENRLPVQTNNPQDKGTWGREKLTDEGIKTLIITAIGSTELILKNTGFGKEYKKNKAFATFYDLIVNPIKTNIVTNMVLGQAGDPQKEYFMGVVPIPAGNLSAILLNLLKFKITTENTSSAAPIDLHQVLSQLSGDRPASESSTDADYLDGVGGNMAGAVADATAKIRSFKNRILRDIVTATLTAEKEGRPVESLRKLGLDIQTIQVRYMTALKTMTTLVEFLDQILVNVSQGRGYPFPMKDIANITLNNNPNTFVFQALATVTYGYVTYANSLFEAITGSLITAYQKSLSTNERADFRNLVTEMNQYMSIPDSQIHKKPFSVGNQIVQAYINRLSRRAPKRQRDNELSPEDEDLNNPERRIPKALPPPGDKDKDQPAEEQPEQQVSSDDEKPVLTDEQQQLVKKLNDEFQELKRKRQEARSEKKKQEEILYNNLVTFNRRRARDVREGKEDPGPPTDKQVEDAIKEFWEHQKKLSSPPEEPPQNEIPPPQEERKEEEQEEEEIKEAEERAGPEAGAPEEEEDTEEIEEEKEEEVEEEKEESSEEHTESTVEMTEEEQREAEERAAPEVEEKLAYDEIERSEQEKQQEQRKQEDDYEASTDDEEEGDKNGQNKEQQQEQELLDASTEEEDTEEAEEEKAEEVEEAPLVKLGKKRKATQQVPHEDEGEEERPPVKAQRPSGKGPSNAVTILKDKELSAEEKLRQMELVIMGDSSESESEAESSRETEEEESEPEGDNSNIVQRAIDTLNMEREEEEEEESDEEDDNSYKLSLSDKEYMKAQRAKYRTEHPEYQNVRDALDTTTTQRVKKRAENALAQLEASTEMIKMYLHFNAMKGRFSAADNKAILARLEENRRLVANSKATLLAIFRNGKNTGQTRKRK